MKPANELARRRIKQIHFVGIGGAGMGGIAEVIKHLGYRVTGSDIAQGPMTDRLKDLGVEIHIGHAAENITGANVVVTSSAVSDENPEVVEARQTVFQWYLVLRCLLRLCVSVTVLRLQVRTVKPQPLA